MGTDNHNKPEHAGQPATTGGPDPSSPPARHSAPRAGGRAAATKETALPATAPAGGDVSARGASRRRTKSLGAERPITGAIADASTAGVRSGRDGPGSRSPKAAIAGAATRGSDGLAANLAGDVAKKAIEGDGSSAARRGTGRYVGAATSGAVAGAQAGAAAGGVGAAPGAAIGAAKNVALEAGKDSIRGVSRLTGGGPAAEPADKRLGAGGTSYERDERADGGSRGSKAVQGVAVGGAAAAAPPAMAVIMLMALLNWLKSMFFTFLAMAGNLASLIWSLIVNLVKAAAHAVAAPFMAIGGLVAKGAGAMLGITVGAAVAPAAAAASGVVTTVAVAALVGTVLTGILSNPAQIDGQIGSSAICTVNSRSGGDAQAPAGSEANARVVYSVLKTWGMPEENIAGILGNWSQESGVDPTSVQNFPVGTYTMTAEKETAARDTDNGIGLGQWTFGRNALLREYAQARGVDWYTIEAQLAFMAEGDNAGDVAVFQDMLRTSQGSPGAAALHFHHNWERSADGAQGLAEREADAEWWYARMSGWTVDRSAASGVESILGDILDSIGTGIRVLLGNCRLDEGGGVTLGDGGMTQEEAQALVDLYNEEGDRFLDGRYGDQGGPGSCGSNHAMNCVSFSTYFVNKYTTFQTYPMGNGIQTAYTIASETGKQMLSTPTAYSVGSGPGSGPAGHTLVVLGVEGDTVILGEAGYCAFMGRVRVASAAQLTAEGWKFVDMSDSMLPPDQIKTS